MTELKFIYTVVKPNIVFSSDPMTIEEIENGDAKRFLQLNGFLPMSHQVHKRQYIGKNDNSNQEIYIGDIVKVKYVYPDENFDDVLGEEEIGVVRWDEEFGGWIINDGSCLYTAKVIEKIGDIYRNPELIPNQQ